MVTVGYTMDVMYFGWLPSPVDVDVGVQLPQFTLQDVILYDCSQNYTAGLCSTVTLHSSDSPQYHTASTTRRTRIS